MFTKLIDFVKMNKEAIIRTGTVVAGVGAGLIVVAIAGGQPPVEAVTEVVETVVEQVAE